MGRWHYEMAGLNFIVRQVVRLVFATNFAPGTYEEALASFQSAANLNPGRLIHRVELARTYHRCNSKSYSTKIGFPYMHLTEVGSR